MNADADTLPNEDWREIREPCTGPRTGDVLTALDVLQETAARQQRQAAAVTATREMPPYDGPYTGELEQLPAGDQMKALGTIDRAGLEHAAEAMAPDRGRHRVARERRPREKRRLRVPACWPLLAVLAVQAALSLRLVWSNTAFTDEALYLWAGRLEWAHWLHGSALPPSFPTYFSGAPVVYPPLGAAMAAAGGLASARLLSLVFILTASVLLHGTASRMFGRMAGLFAAAVFAATGSVQFLGAFATYDAMALMLLALATWLSVFAASRSMAAQVSLSLLAGFVLSVADAAKYAAALWDPIVICVMFLAAWRTGGWRRAVAAALSFLASLAAAVAAALKVGGPEYWRGIEFTTLGRQHGDSSAYGIAWDSIGWVGIVIALAVIGSVVAGRQAGAVTRLMAWVLTFGAVLAPANQARIHVFTSLFKHVGFGSWFAAVMAGVALASLADAVPRTKRLAAFRVASAAVVSAAVIGALLAANQFMTWPASSSLTSVVTSALAADPGPVFAADSANVLEYYIADPAPGVAFYGQWYFQYQDPASRKFLVDGPAFADAIKHRFFTAITLSFGDKRGVNQEITADIKRYGGYKTVTVPPAQSAAWHVTYRAWVRDGAGK